jgi:hypothetical protein
MTPKVKGKDGRNDKTHANLSDWGYRNPLPRRLLGTCPSQSLLSAVQVKLFKACGIFGRGMGKFRVGRERERRGEKRHLMP